MVCLLLFARGQVRLYGEPQRFSAAFLLRGDGFPRRSAPRNDKNWGRSLFQRRCVWQGGVCVCRRTNYAGSTFNFPFSTFHFQLSPLSYPSGGAHTIAADKGLFLVRNFCGKEVSPREHEDRKQLIKKMATPDKTALRSRRDYLQRETEMVRCN